MALKWRNSNGCNDDPEKNAEMCVSLNSLRLYKELGFKGGVLRNGEKIVAFTVGEELCKDTFVVHIEKAFADVQGAYPMINQQFVEHECMDYTYVNREDDAGEEGLPMGKILSSAFLEEKGFVTRIEDSNDFKKMENMVANSSAIRAMLKRAANVAAKIHLTEKNVFDFSLGNPNVPGTGSGKEQMIEILSKRIRSCFTVTTNSNAGYEDVRQAVADSLNERFGKLCFPQYYDDSRSRRS